MMAALIRRLSSSARKSTQTHHLSQPNPSFFFPSSSSSSFPTTLVLFRRGIASKLFVSGLSFYTTENGLSETFSQYGQVIEAKIVMDRLSERSKGFGFITFASEDEAKKAIIEMNGKQLNGRVIFVDHARPRSRFDLDGGMPIARGPPEPAADR